MLKRAGTAVVAFIIAVGFWVGTVQDVQAQVRVTVMGQDYDIIANLGSFNQVQTTTGNGLTNTSQSPWYTGSTDSTLAEAFRDAWVTANDTSTVAASSEIAFAFNISGGDVSIARAFNGPPASAFGTLNVFATATTLAGAGGLYYATATLVAVPEINGNSLAQMLLVLFVGYLMVRARRRLV